MKQSAVEGLIAAVLILPPVIGMITCMVVMLIGANTQENNMADLTDFNTDWEFHLALSSNDDSNLTQKQVAQFMEQVRILATAADIQIAGGFSRPDGMEK